MFNSIVESELDFIRKQFEDEPYQLLKITNLTPIYDTRLLKQNPSYMYGNLKDMTYDNFKGILVNNMYELYACEGYMRHSYELIGFKCSKDMSDRIPLCVITCTR